MSKRAKLRAIPRNNIISALHLHEKMENLEGVFVVKAVYGNGKVSPHMNVPWEIERACILARFFTHGGVLTYQHRLGSGKMSTPLELTVTEVC